VHDPRDDFRAAILAALGHAPDVIEPGRFQRFATRDRRGDTAGWCKLFNDLRGGVFGCYRQSISETWSAASRAMMTRAQRADLARQVMAATAEREAEQRKQWAANARRIAQLWADCLPLVPGDTVTLYLKRRGLGGVWPLPEPLRLHRALPYWHDGETLGTFPAMVAPLVAPDGRIVALHRTYLTTDGRKAEVPTVKKVTGAAGPLAGVCIPLHKPARGCIGIAEGIETALAAWCASSVPTVAAYCTGNVASWRWPAGARRLVIFADADEAGFAAAEKLRQRARAAGMAVNVKSPTDAGADWCDVWAARDAAVIDGAAA
jgi:putative DNA primase/helicase